LSQLEGYQVVVYDYAPPESIHSETKFLR